MLFPPGPPGSGVTVPASALRENAEDEPPSTQGTSSGIPQGDGCAQLLFPLGTLNLTPWADSDSGVLHKPQLSPHSFLDYRYSL